MLPGDQLVVQYVAVNSSACCIGVFSRRRQESGDILLRIPRQAACTLLHMNKPSTPRQFSANGERAEGRSRFNVVYDMCRVVEGIYLPAEVEARNR